MLRNVFKSLVPVSEKKSRPTQRHTRLGGESLEARLPLTSVSLNLGLLTITGDTAGPTNDTITIAQTAAPGTFLVSSPTLPGGVHTEIGVKSIAISTGVSVGAGNDRVNFVAAAGAANFAGKIAITGNGNLTVDLVGADHNLSGSLKITDTFPTGTLIVSNDTLLPLVGDPAGTDQLGNVNIAGSNGGTSISLAGVVINGSATFSLGNGQLGPANTLSIGEAAPDAEPAVITGNLTVKGGDQNDVVVLAATTVDGNVTASLGGSNGGAVADAFAATVSTFNGNVSVTDHGQLTAVFANSSVLRGLSIDTSASVQNTVVAIDGSTFKGAVNITTGAGNDTVLVETLGAPGVATEFFGAVSIKMGAGNDAIALGGADQVIFFASALFEGGTGTNTLAPTNVQFLGSNPVIKHLG